MVNQSSHGQFLPETSLSNVTPFDPSPALKRLFAASDDLIFAAELIPDGDIRAAIYATLVRVQVAEEALSGVRRYDF